VRRQNGLDRLPRDAEPVGVHHLAELHRVMADELGERILAHRRRMGCHNVRYTASRSAGGSRMKQ
jgi:hypothetical protein